MPELPELDRRLAALRDAAATLAPPPSVDAAIRDGIADARPRRLPRLRMPELAWLAVPVGIAATVAVVTTMPRTPSDAPLAPPAASVAAATPASTGTAFVPVVPIAELERARDPLVVPARLSQMSLAELGLPVNPARAADIVDTELLVRRDGSLLAVRFTY